MKSYKKIVLFDMDDTLSDFKTGIIPASAYRAIDLLHERKDILIGMASGRGHFFFRDQRPDIKADAFICVNGQCATVFDDIVFEGKVEDEDVKKLYALLESMNGGLYAVNSFKGIKALLEPKDPVMAIAHSVTRLKDYGSSFSDDYTNHLLQAAFLPEYDEMFEKAFPHLSFHRYYEYMVDIFPKETSKLRGIEAVAKHVGLTMVDVIAFGDGMNDVEMIEGVNFGIAMGNAQPEVKAVADHVTDTVNNDGVYKALLHLELIKEEI